MAVTNGRWEGQIVVPTGGWDMELVEAAPASGSGTATVSAGTYSWATFITEVNDALDAAGNASYNSYLNDGEGAAGSAVLQNDTTNEFAITWTDTALRDLLGFTGDLSGGNAYTLNHVKGLWLPDTAPITPYGISDPTDELNETVTESEDAEYMHALIYSRKLVYENLTFEALAAKKVRIAQESTTGESLQQFLRDVCEGDVSYLTLRRVRIFPDADVDGTYIDVRIGARGRKFAPPQTSERYTGLFDVIFPRIVQVP